MLFIRSKIQFFESKSQPSTRWCRTWVSCLSDQRYNFLKANHNNYPIFVFVFELFIRSKMQFFESKSQPLEEFFIPINSCLSDQRYNFLKANHNLFKWINYANNVVYQIKDTIFWKQITTLPFEYDCSNGCLSDQRYNFLKANHNFAGNLTPSAEVVYQIKDTIFWKQITTRLYGACMLRMLFIRSKIQFFESKSQHHGQKPTWHPGCLSDQRYNFLKANHNSYQKESLGLNVVYQIKDTIFWKQITTKPSGIRLWSCCLSDQRYNFLKANHNQHAHLIQRIPVVYQIKDTIFWKQITTLQHCVFSDSLLFIRSKIQFFESKSQHAWNTRGSEAGCLSDQRYNFLKANHNETSLYMNLDVLFIRSKIQFFESKSQLPIHKPIAFHVVYQIKDTIFWKQITTTLL